MEAPTDQPTLSVHTLPPEAIAFAHQQFDRARNGDELLIQYVEAGLIYPVPVNLTNDAGNSLIMLASYGGHAELVRKLVAKGADTNRMNERGQTPIAGAAFKGYFDVVSALLQGAADPLLGQPNAIDTAEMFKHEAIVNLLKKPKASANDNADR